MVRFDPNIRRQERASGKDEWQDIPKYISLAHELCGHVLIYNQGMAVPEPSYDANEETAVIMENYIRLEKKLKERLHYYTTNDWHEEVIRTIADIDPAYAKTAEQGAGGGRPLGEAVDKQIIEAPLMNMPRPSIESTIDVPLFLPPSPSSSTQPSSVPEQKK